MLFDNCLPAWFGTILFSSMLLCTFLFVLFTSCVCKWLFSVSLFEVLFNFVTIFFGCFNNDKFFIRNSVMCVYMCLIDR